MTTVVDPAIFNAPSTTIKSLVPPPIAVELFKSKSTEPPPLKVRLPVTVSVPATPLPPGLMTVPELSVMEPLMAPLPFKVPPDTRVAPPLRAETSSVAFEAMLMVGLLRPEPIKARVPPLMVVAPV